MGPPPLPPSLPPGTQIISTAGLVTVPVDDQGSPSSGGKSGRKYEYTKLETWRHFLEACKVPDSEGSPNASLSAGKAVAEVAMSDPVWRSLDRLQREQISHAVAYGIVLMRESAANPNRLIHK